MMSAIGAVSYKNFESFHSDRYAERELNIINDAFLYTCANTQFQKISDISNVDELISDNFIGKYEIIHEGNSYSIKYFKNGRTYILNGSELNNLDSDDGVAIVDSFTNNVKQNMINEIGKFIDSKSQIIYGTNDRLREYLLENVYNGEWPQLTKTFCLKYGIPYDLADSYYIQPYIYLSMNPDASEHERKLSKDDLEKVVIFIRDSVNNGWFTYYINVEGQWYYVNKGISITLPYEELVKKVKENPFKFKPLK